MYKGSKRECLDSIYNENELIYIENYFSREHEDKTFMTYICWGDNQMSRLKTLGILLLIPIVIASVIYIVGNYI